MLRIEGAGFDYATAVDFGPKPAPSWRVVRPDEILATVPPGKPRAVNVTVTSIWGTSSVSLADRLTYLSARGLYRYFGRPSPASPFPARVDRRLGAQRAFSEPASSSAARFRPISAVVGSCSATCRPNQHTPGRFSRAR